MTLRQPIKNSIGLTLIPIPPGTFRMGLDYPRRQWRWPYSDYVPAYAVRLEGNRAMSATLVTVHQWTTVMGPHEAFGPDTDPALPITFVSWLEAMAFCQRLSELPAERTTGRLYRLPTEAEWEYMCRAGGRGLFAAGVTVKNLHHYAWYGGRLPPSSATAGGPTRRAKHPVPVAQLRPNAWGLYDMHGNVYEWCFDSNYDELAHYVHRYLRGQIPINPALFSKTSVLPTVGAAVRGGNHVSPAMECACMVRWRGGRGRRGRYPDVGFRIVLDDPASPLTHYGTLGRHPFTLA